MKLLAATAITMIAIIHLMSAQVQPLSRQDSGLLMNYNQQFEKFQSQGNVKEASRYLNDIAFLYWNHNMYAKAVEYYEKSLALNNVIDNENGIAMIQNNLGMLYADLQNYDKSLENFSKTLAARRSLKENIGIISALINRSVVYNNLKRFDESINDLQEALTLARSMNDMDQMKSVYGMLSETYEKNGQIDLSLQYFDLYRSFHEQVQRKIVGEVSKKLEEESVQKKLIEAEINAKELELLRNKLELAEKEREISNIDSINQSLYNNLSRAEIELQLLERDAELRMQEAKLNEERAQSLEKQQLLTYIIAFIIVVSLLLISFLIYFNYQRTKNINKQLTKTNELLEKQGLELAEANDVKNKLFSIVAHDLRSPFYAIKSFFLITDDYELPQELTKAFSQLKIQLFETTVLLENLLNWSSTQMHNNKPNLSTFDLKKVVEQNIKSVSPLAQQKQLIIKDKVPPNTKIEADPGIVDVVLRNLIQNAIKFSTTGGEIEIDAFGNNGTINVSVKDTGVGIEKEKQKEIFQFKTNKSTLGTNKEHGSGLGLYLCAELLKKNNGTLNLFSEPGKGSTFTFTLKKSL